MQEDESSIGELGTCNEFKKGSVASAATDASNNDENKSIGSHNTRRSNGGWNFGPKQKHVNLPDHLAAKQYREEKKHHGGITKAATDMVTQLSYSDSVRASEII
ncbi:MAG: hypothetical protein ACREOZ_02290 [Gloeomargaritales cyanobacterium]